MTQTQNIDTGRLAHLRMKAPQSVVIGEGLHRLLKITVLEFQGDCVKLGFETESDLLILRAELWQRLCPKAE